MTKTRCAVQFTEMPEIKVSKERPGGKSLAQMIREGKT